MTWIRACAVDEIDDGEAVQVPTDPPVAVFRVGDRYLAVDDTCTHGQSSLSDGYIDGEVVECAWHFAKFDLNTGEALSAPATAPLCTYRVRIEGDDVLLETP